MVANTSVPTFVATTTTTMYSAGVVFVACVLQLVIATYLCLPKFTLSLLEQCTRAQGANIVQCKVVSMGWDHSK